MGRMDIVALLAARSDAAVPTAPAAAAAAALVVLAGIVRKLVKLALLVLLLGAVAGAYAVWRSGALG